MTHDEWERLEKELKAARRADEAIGWFQLSGLQSIESDAGLEVGVDIKPAYQSKGYIHALDFIDSAMRPFKLQVIDAAIARARSERAAAAQRALQLLEKLSGEDRR